MYRFFIFNVGLRFIAVGPVIDPTAIMPKKITIFHHFDQRQLPFQ